jgi:hypothetical protein
MKMRNEKHQAIISAKSVNHEVFDTIRNAEPVEFYGFTQAVMVTPEMAETFLKYNSMNRGISDIVNLRYAQAMEAGHWRFNGETIVFSNQGILLDGQNRLKAIIKSGVTVPMLAVYGIETENFKTMDQGSKRTTGQILKILDCKNNNTLAATLRLAYIYLYLDNKMKRSGSDAVYHQVLLSLLERYPSIKESVKKAAPARRLCNRTIVAFCHFVFSLRDPRGADQFIRQVITGEDLHAGDPALSLRNVLIQNKGENIKPGSRTLIALFFKAWNYVRKGKTIKNLRWRDTEAFPEVI